MIRLTATNTDLLSLITAQNGAKVVVSYSDATSSAYTGGTDVTSIASATTTTIVATPAASTVRDVDEINIKNTFAGSHTMTVQYSRGGTLYPMFTASLLTDESISYTHGSGWCALDASGNRKEAMSGLIAGTTLSITGNATIGGALGVTGATTLSSALTYGGVTLSNAVTGTGNMVLSASPTFTGTVTAAAITASDTVTVTKATNATFAAVASTDNNALISFTTNSVLRGLVQGNSVNMTVGSITNIPTIIISNNATVGSFSSTGLAVTGGFQVGAPTGGDKGAGTANFAADIYKNNTAYTNPDYVLEHWTTGSIVQFADKEGAKDYSGLMSLQDTEAFARKNLHLPRFGQSAGHGLFGGSDALLASVEEAYLHLFSHSRDLSANKAALAANGITVK